MFIRNWKQIFLLRPRLFTCLYLRSTISKPQSLNFRRCYGDQLILEHFGKRQNRTPWQVALAFCTNATISCKNCGEDWSSSFGGEQANTWKLGSRNSASIWRSSSIRHTGVQKRIGILEFRFQYIYRSSILYFVWNFGEIQFSDPRV